jgi:hypothetical protein
MERDRPPGYHQRAIVDGDLKLVAIAPADTNLIPWAVRGTFSEIQNVSVGTYLFDLSEDPAETCDIYAQGDKRVERLIALLASFMEGEVAESDSVHIDEATRERLKALGYIQ